MERRIYLLRHGRPELPQDVRLCLGHTDVPLSAQGREQMRRLAPDLAPLGITALYCSDLARSWMSAAILAETLGLAPRPRRALREMAMGLWDGRTFAEIRRLWPEEYRKRGQDMWQYAPPGGESFALCAARASAALAAVVQETDGAVVIAAHAGFNRALLWTLGVRPSAGVLAIRQDYGAVNCLKLWEDGHWQVEAVNVKRFKGKGDDGHENGI